MNVLDLIKTDHQEADTLFKKIENLLDAEEHNQIPELFQALKTSLLLHSKSEALAVYDRLVSEKTVKDFAFEGEEEHGLIEELFAKLDGSSQIDDSWKGSFTVLKELVEHHVEEEEEELFPKMKKVFLRSELEDMAHNMKRQKEILQGTEEFVEFIQAAPAMLTRMSRNQGQNRGRRI